MREEAEQMQGVRLVRIDIQDLTIDQLGLLWPTFAMMAEGNFESGLRIERVKRHGYASCRRMKN
jgi:hypothetical protein